jgi:N-acetylneuraminate synthase/sialic acid synthase
MPREIILGGKTVNDDSPCYVIAEIGHNHGGSLTTCIDMIDAAKDAGCDCVKLQKRTNRELYTKEMFDSPYTGRNSYGRTYGEHREALEFGEKDYVTIRKYCRAVGIDFAATAFDATAADFLVDVGVDWIKIASGDLTNLPLLEHVAKHGLPVVFSTGGALGLSQVLTAYNAIRSENDKVAVLQCTSGYPAEWDELNLRTIEEFRKAMPEAVVGWSMHARGISQAVAAYTLGARILEAHFTLDRYSKGTDQSMSLEPKGMAAMVRYLGYCRQALGDGRKRRYVSEEQPLLKQWKNADGRVDGRAKYNPYTHD